MKIKTKIRKEVLIVGILSFFIFFLINVNAASDNSGLSTSYQYIGGTGYTPQYYQPNFQTYYTSEQINTYWNLFQKDDCKSRQDFIVQIRPGGCSPAVVRSDLLEEQNVPVFCQLDAVKLNPLIDVKAIDSISFKSANGSYPSEVLGVSFHPARAALNTRDKLLGSPLINNIGYVVILLKRNPVEKNMTNWVRGNLTATISYNLEKAFGVGKAEFIVPQLSDDGWKQHYKEYSFWQGRTFLRLETLDAEKAKVGIYTDATNKIGTATIKIGETSSEIYLPTFYCQAAMQVKLNSISLPEDKIRLAVDNGETTDALWLVKGSSFLNGKCSVSGVEIDDFGTGKASLRCGSESFTLSLGTPSDIRISKDDAESILYKKWNLINRIIPNPNDKNNVYIAYAGQLPDDLAKTNPDAKGESKAVEKEFIVLINSEKELSESDKINYDSQIKGALSGAKLQSKNIDELKINFGNYFKDAKAFIITKGDTVKGIGGSSYAFLGFERADSALTGDVIRKEALDYFFNKTVEEARSIARKYYSETKENKETFGETALFEAVKLADDLGKYSQEKIIIEEFIRTYPNSRYIVEAENMLSRLGGYDSSNASRVVSIDNRAVSIKLVDMKKVGKDEASTELFFDNKVMTFMKDEIYTLPDLKDPKRVAYSLKITSLNDSSVGLTAEYDQTDANGGTSKKTETKSVGIGESATLGNKLIRVNKINLKKVAKLSIIPKIAGTTGEANFSYNIGIEKRAIQLSPEKTKEMIKTLNDSIARWEDINKRLGEVITAWKGVCFATSTILMMKQMLSSFSGSADTLARQQVMRNSGGWIDSCNDKIKRGEGNYVSLDHCLSANSAKIDADVATVAKAIEAENKKVKTASENFKKADVLGLGSVIDSKNASRVYMEKNILNQQIMTDTREIILPNGDKIQIKDAFRSADATTKAQKDGYLTWGDMRDADMWYGIYNSAPPGSDLQNMAEKKLSSTLSSINGATRIGEAADQTTAFSGINTIKPTLPLPENWRGDLPVSMGTLTSKQVADMGLGGKVAPDTDTKNVNTVMLVSIPKLYRNQQAGPGGAADSSQAYNQIQGNNFVVKMKAGAGGKYVVDSAYQVGADGKAVQVDDKTLTAQTEQINRYFANELRVSSFTAYQSGTCNNAYTNPEVRYFETAPYKGMPAIVPIDVQKGWYAGMKQTLPVLGNTKTYQDSGRVVSFYLCNVGKNGREDFSSGARDDVCTLINTETGQPTDQLGCITPAEAKLLVNRAIQDIQTAAEQYGKTNVRLSSGSYRTGKPAASQLGTQCQDFMSPDDCLWLFRACDPVLCPTSRCNLGGAYYVDNVVQSGIIGSIVLCWPNIREGIIPPVCLTGIHAGLEMWISILKQRLSCLNESLTSGRTVGICDQLHSIYMCEFFWRQFAPFIKELIPRMVASFYGQGVQGGGEYLTVQTAWDNLQSSISYFKDFYGLNAFKAFQVRSTAEVGTELCKAFVGTSFPNDIKGLLEPESPMQFSAWFQEIPFTSATVPATSQYKVFYHIYAGKDEGGAYSVYLQSPPDSSFYQSIGRIIVKSGYIAKGDSADETIDMTAPAGYKELCVRVNMKEQCGFGSVSTSFALNYVKEKYVQDQVGQSVTTERECVSGSVTLNSAALSMINPSVQAGAENALMPSIYNRGIVRVCASINPGNSTEPGRWKAVGYCDNKDMTCWLDTKTVEKNIKNKNILNETIGDINKAAINSGVEGVNLWEESKTRTKLDELKNSKDVFVKALSNNIQEGIKKDSANNYQIETSMSGLISKAVAIEQSGLMNVYKAGARLLIFEAYDEITKAIKTEYFTKQITTSTVTAAGTAGTQPDYSKVWVFKSLSNLYTYFIDTPAGWKYLSTSTAYTKSNIPQVNNNWKPVDPGIINGIGLGTSDSGKPLSGATYEEGVQILTKTPGISELGGGTANTAGVDCNKITKCEDYGTNENSCKTNPCNIGIYGQNPLCITTPCPDLIKNQKGACGVSSSKNCFSPYIFELGRQNDQLSTYIYMNGQMANLWLRVKTSGTAGIVYGIDQLNSNGQGTQYSGIGTIWEDGRIEIQKGMTDKANTQLSKLAYHYNFNDKTKQFTFLG